MRIGIDLGGTKIEGIILEDDGTVKTSIRIDTPGKDYAPIVDATCELIERLQSESEERLTVGIGTPGTLSGPHQLMKNCNSVCLNDQPLKQDLESRLGYSLRLENDANCFTLSEAIYGAAAEAGTVFGVILGTGTGGGIVINKQLLTGPNNIAGEWGHNGIPCSVRELIRDDRRCYCGRNNCIETVLSGRGLKQTYGELTGSELEAIDIARQAAQGDQRARDCIDHYCQQLARCLSTVVNVIDPHVIVLGGGLSNIGQLYQAVPAYMKEFVFNDSLETKLLPPTFGDASGARGAACLWPAGAEEAE